MQVLAGWPQPRVFLDRRYVEGRKVNEPRVIERSRPQRRRDIGDGVPGAFKELGLQQSGHLRAAQGVGVLLAKDQNVHGRPILLSRENLSRSRTA